MFPSFCRPLAQSDEHARLLVSVWNHNSRQHCSELVGCLSFGIRHLQAKCRQQGIVAGWYFLLSADLGHRKHIRTGSSHDKCEHDASDDASENKENELIAVRTSYSFKLF